MNSPTHNPPRSTPIPTATRCGLLLAACCLLVTLTGCGEYVNETYGRRSGFGGDSINGTGVFAQMLTNQGHRVRSTTHLYPRVGKADVIVWFSQDWDAPSPEAAAWFDNWLRYSEDGEGKTLIYVSRDYSAGEHYWTTTKPSAPAEQKGEYDSRRRDSQSTFNTWRGMAPSTDEAGDWFTVDRRNTKRAVTGLSGPWAEGVDASATDIEHRQFLTPSADADVLLADDQGHPLVSEIVYEPQEWDYRYENSRVVMIENGSFLLNASLVNKEHRKLAGKLIDSLDPPTLDVVFLEQGGDVIVLQSDPNEGPPTGFKLFTIWPIGAVLAQAAALGLVFAASRWPIFGTPRRIERESLTDFGRHVRALGRLLAATGDRAYAEAQLRAYFQKDEKDK